MIAEARADNKDNDVEFMKPGSGRCKHQPSLVGDADY
jgi:hypothetical protein